MDLLQFVRQLPKEWATAPIYAKDKTLPDGTKACGKNPLGRAHTDNLAPEASAIYIERSPDTFQAIGVFAGPRSNGLVIFDVDANLGIVQEKWGDDLAKAPKITSPKKNAAKYLFRVPKENWGEVKGISLAESKEGWEVLWGRQGLLYGAYPKGGEYAFEGDANAVPEAPGWLLERMKESKREELSKQEQKQSKDGRYSNRTREEKIAIAEACLGAIPAPGRGSEDLWWRIGAMLHSELPNEDGLRLWMEWSLKDPEYADDWAGGQNPCENRWEQGFKAGGGLGFGSLINLADHHDPSRLRFQGNRCAQVLAEVEAAAVTIRQAVLTFDEIIERGMKIYEGEDVARMNYELHALAMEARYKDQSGVEKLLLDHMTQQNRGVGFDMDAPAEDKREYLIPGLFPMPYTVLFFGEHGCGKSATAIALMKHVVDGIPFQLKNHTVPVQQGTVIYFNGDMSNQDFREEFDLHEIKNRKAFRFEPDFNLYRRVQFVKTMNKYKPAMICIDSLSSCSGAKAGDENKAEFAQPLYWLNANNGTLWPPCTIVVLHHAAKAGGARGSSAIGAAVAEVWSIQKPAKDSGLSIDQRIISIGKSRIGRSGESLIQTQNDDLTVSLVEAKKPEEMQTRAGTVAERIMNRLQTSKEPMSRADLNADPLVGGSIAAIRKTLQRLENRGVVEVTSRSTPTGPVNYYSALRAWGESVEVGQRGETPGDDSKGGWDTGAKTEECPTPPLSGGADSETVGTDDLCPRAGEGRSSEELAKLNDEAWNLWD